MISEKQKKNALDSFYSAKQLASKVQKRSILEKIKSIQSFADLIKKISRKIAFFKRHTSFTINDRIVSLFYGKVTEAFFVFQTNLNDVKQIKNILDSSKQLKFKETGQSNYEVRMKRGTQQINPELLDRMNANQTWFEINKNATYDNFLKKIKPILRNYLKSPFSVVNLNAWKTKPDMDVAFDLNHDARGPNRLHKDGYPAGHFKCMIYIKPLNESHGKLQIEGEIFESEEPGFSLIFNTEAFHQSIPGNSKDRYVFEITVMRTIFEVDMLKYYPSVPDSTHFFQAYQAYI